MLKFIHFPGNFFLFKICLCKLFGIFHVCCRPSNPHALIIADKYVKYQRCANIWLLDTLDLQIAHLTSPHLAISNVSLHSVTHWDGKISYTVPQVFVENNKNTFLLILHEIKMNKRRQQPNILIWWKESANISLFSPGRICNTIQIQRVYFV